MGELAHQLARMLMDYDELKKLLVVLLLRGLADVMVVEELFGAEIQLLQALEQEVRLWWEEEALDANTGVCRLVVELHYFIDVVE